MRKIQFDDIDSLKEMISEEYGEWSKPFQVTQKVINDFAELTNDHQWIHVDVEKAKKGPFGTTIAHGFLTLSLTSRTRPKSEFIVVGQQSTVNYGSEGLRFLSPVLSDSTIHSRSRITGVAAHKAGTRLTMEIAIHMTDSERPSLIYNAVILYAGAR